MPMVKEIGVRRSPSSQAGFKTWKCKVDAPGVWCFRILNGSIRFFSPLNSVFASCPENLPRFAQ